MTPGPLAHEYPRVTAIDEFPDDLPVRPLPPSCVALLQRIGVDTGNPQDIRDLAATVRWATEERMRQAQREVDRSADRRERRSRLYAVGYGVVATGVGGLVTWLISHGALSWNP